MVSSRGISSDIEANNQSITGYHAVAFPASPDIPGPPPNWLRDAEHSRTFSTGALYSSTSVTAAWHWEHRPSHGLLGPHWSLFGLRRGGEWPTGAPFGLSRCPVTTTCHTISLTLLAKLPPWSSCSVFGPQILSHVATGGVEKHKNFPRMSQKERG